MGRASGIINFELRPSRRALILPLRARYVNAIHSADNRGDERFVPENGDANETAAKRTNPFSPPFTTANSPSPPPPRSRRIDRVYTRPAEIQIPITIPFRATNSTSFR